MNIHTYLQSSLNYVPLQPYFPNLNPSMQTVEVEIRSREHPKNKVPVARQIEEQSKAAEFYLLIQALN